MGLGDFFKNIFGKKKLCVMRKGMRHDAPHKNQEQGIFM